MNENPGPCALPDWYERRLKGESIVPRVDLTLPDFDHATAERGLRLFSRLRLHDVFDNPTVGETAGEWIKQYAYMWFGAQNPRTFARYCDKGLLLVAKKNGKTTYGALMMLTMMCLSRRPNSQWIVVSPSLEVSEIAHKAITGAIHLDPELSARWSTTAERERRITDKIKGSRTELKVRSAEGKVNVGSLCTGVLVDELHVLAKSIHAESMLLQLEGAAAARPDFSMLSITTHAEEQAEGVWETALAEGRAVRDGDNPAPILFTGYEYPQDVVESEGWRDPGLWFVPNPNLGYSVRREFLDSKYAEYEAKGVSEHRRWVSQHLNVEVGMLTATDAWAGARYWPQCAEEDLTWDGVIERSDVVVAGIDAGGLDDFASLAILGRDRESGFWLHAVKSWIMRSALGLRVGMAVKVQGFAEKGWCTILETGEEGRDLTEICAAVKAIKDKGLFPGENAVGVDARGMEGLKAALFEDGGLDEYELVDIAQGVRLHPYILTLERMLADKLVRHEGNPVMTWAVGNARTEWRGSAITINKENALQKIDPLAATLDATALMVLEPEAAGEAGFTFLKM